MTGSQKSAIFEGVEEISSDDCLDIARLKTKQKDVEVENVKMKKFGETPAGFGGDHYRMKITVRQNAKGEIETENSDLVDLDFFVKTKPRDLSHCDTLESMGVIERELDFFSTLLPLLLKYVSDEKGNSMQVPWTADCYLANKRLIVLDDLTREEYSLLENRTAMNYNHCKVMFETIARFHALTIIFEEKESQQRGTPYRLNEVYPEMFKENTWTYDPPENAGKKICDSSVYGLLSLIKIMPQLKQDSKKFEVIQNAFTHLFRDVNKLVEVSTEVRNVASHGDLWANNIMFKYNADRSKPISSRIIDFQLLRYTAPAHDFVCALYLNCDREVRSQHFLSLAEAYHAALAAELSRFGLDVDKLVPWPEFAASLEHYRMLGILTACSYYPPVLLPEEIANVVFGDPEKLNKFMVEDQSEWACLSFETDAIFRKRISDLVDELVEYLMTLRT